MPFPQLARTVQGRASAQAGSNTETRQAVVKRTYGDSSGNILFADVRLPGQTADLVHVPNRTTLKLAVGDQVTVNFVQGQSHYPQIVGAAGGGTAAAASAESAANSGANIPPTMPADFASAPVLLQSPSGTARGGFVEVPGANVLFIDTPPGTTSGGAVNGQRTITMRPLVSPILPSPAATSLPDGTLLDLVDSYGNPQGMYRLDVGVGVWRRRDSGGGNAALTPATASALGGVKIGANVAVTADGTISTASLLAATASTLGGVKAGSGLAVAGDGTLSTKLSGYLANDYLTVAGGLTASTAFVFGLMPPHPATGASVAYTPVRAKFSCKVAPSGGPVTVDIFINGASILTAPLSIASGATSQADVTAFVSGTSYSTFDVLSWRVGPLNGADGLVLVLDSTGTF